MDSLKMQIKYAADQEQARETIEILAAFGYRAKPILTDLMRECEDEKVKLFCKEALHRMGWISE